MTESLTKELNNLSLFSRNKHGGGKNTNANGLKFEKTINFKYNILKNVKTKKYEVNSIELLDIKNRKFIYPQTKKSFYSYLENKGYVDLKVIKGHGCKQPDKCLIDEENKIIYLFEIKFQKVSGSVCEKLQTAPFKIYNYKQCIPDFKINYIYLLNDYFEKKCKA